MCELRLWATVRLLLCYVLHAFQVLSKLSSCGSSSGACMSLLAILQLLPSVMLACSTVAVVSSGRGLACAVYTFHFCGACLALYCCTV